MGRTRTIRTYLSAVTIWLSYIPLRDSTERRFSGAPSTGQDLILALVATEIGDVQHVLAFCYVVCSECDGAEIAITPIAGIRISCSEHRFDVFDSGVPADLTNYDFFTNWESQHGEEKAEEDQ